MRSTMRELIPVILLVAGFTMQGVAQGSEQVARFSAATFMQITTQKAPRALASTPFAATQVLSFDAARASEVFMKSAASTLLLSDFPLQKNQYGTIELHRARPVIDGETDIIHMGKNGAEPMPIPAMINYRGKVRGEENSWVTVVFANGELYSVIERADGSQSQIVPSTEATAKGAHLMTATTNAMMPFHCYADLMPDYHRNTGDDQSYHKGNATQAGSVLKEAEIAIETDRFLFARLKKGNETQAVTEARIVSYVNAIFAVVSQKYEDEVNVTFRISNLTIYSDTKPDPYTANATGDISALLTQVKTYWAGNRGNVARDLVHCLTAPGSGSVGGIAYRQTLCQKGSTNQFSVGAYAVSGIQGGFNLPMLSYIWDTFVVSHEIGHNFASRHTHDCWWAPPLDSCVNKTQIDDACWTGTPKANAGSIMSYCHLIIPAPRFTFLPRVATVIRGGADGASCLTEPAQAKVKVIFPLGGADEIFRSDTTLTVKWTSAKVNTVNVEYSLDSGRIWNSIATGVAAATGNTSWKLPVTPSSNKCLVRVYDSGNQVIGDTSYATFTMNAASITMVTPVGGERLGKNSTKRVEWKVAMVPKCNVDFSPTGGEPWTRLVSGQSTTSMDWTVPDVTTTTAKIRVTDAVMGTPVTESGIFSIGSPILQLNAPVGGEELCVGSNYDITWNADYITSVRIELSTDGGQTFPLLQRISSSTDAKTGIYSWKVPTNRVGTNLRIRVVSNDNAQVLAISPSSFAIKSCAATSVVEDEDTTVLGMGMELLSLLPNPASSEITVRLHNALAARQVECLLMTNDGRSIALGNRIAARGETIQTFSLNDIPQGSYIFALRANGEQLTLPFVVVR